MVEVPRMTKEELRERLGSPDLKVLDCRKDSDFEQSGEKIEGAVRESPEKVDFWMEKYPHDTALVLY